MDTTADDSSRRLAPGPFPRPGFRTGPAIAALFGAAAVWLAFATFPAASFADIYRWEDSAGAVHFTDDVTTIPPEYRKGVTRMIRESPRDSHPEEQAPLSGTMPSRPSAAPGTGTPGGMQPPPEDAQAAPGDAQTEALIIQAEQLRARIAAKEQHIEDVDAKRLPGANPLRNRVVDPKDMELYEKYRAELPGDRERLRELESLLESVR